MSDICAEIHMLEKEEEEKKAISLKSVGKSVCQKSFIRNSKRYITQEQVTAIVISTDDHNIGY